MSNVDKWMAWMFFIFMAGVVVYAIAGLIRLTLETLLDVDFDDDDTEDIL